MSAPSLRAKAVHRVRRARPATIYAGAAAVVALIAWPGVHYHVIKLTGASPWKLGGWAMYVIPSPAIHVMLRDPVAGSSVPAVAAAPCAEAMRIFVGRRRGLGRFASPRRLAECVSRHLSAHTLYLDVVSVRLDGEARRFVRLTEAYVYSRTDGLHRTEPVVVLPREFANF